ncbi:MAG TPA: hypothetical protein VGK96_18170, partial [Candidatus Sulfotelmatobacter sp.]
DHIQGGNFADVAAPKFYEKREPFFLIGFARLQRVCGHWTDESGIQGQPGPKISLSSLPSVGESPNTGLRSVFGGFDSSTRIPHLEKCDSSEPTSGQSESRRGDEKQPSIRDKISRELHRFTIEFGLLFLSLNIVLGPILGYCFYYKRHLLCASIIGIEALLISISVLWLL